MTQPPLLSHRRLGRRFDLALGEIEHWLRKLDTPKFKLRRNMPMLEDDQRAVSRLIGSARRAISRQRAADWPEEWWTGPGATHADAIVALLRAEFALGQSFAGQQTQPPNVGRPRRHYAAQIPEHYGAPQTYPRIRHT